MSINQISNAEPTYQPMPEEMVLDTNDFDIFSSLDDLVVEDVNPQENVQNDDANAMPDLPAENDTEQDDFDFDAFDFDNLDDEQEATETDEDEVDGDIEEDEDFEDEDEDLEEEDTDIDYDDEDLEEEVEYESYMVTLPNGDEVNLQEAVTGYRNAEALEQERTAFEESKERFQEEAGNTYKYLKLARLEADRVVSDYKDFDWATLAKENPQAYVENKEFLEKYMQRRNEIGEAMVDLESKEEADNKAEFQAQAQTCVSELRADIPGWNETLYQDLMAYAVENGTPEEDITNCVDAKIFKMLHKARQFDKGREVAKAKVKKAIRSPKKVTRSAARPAKAKISNKAKLEAKMAAGHTDSSDIFAALED